MLFVRGRQRILDSLGNPVSGAKANFYLTTTTTRVDTYQDAALTVPHTNPVIANAAGFLAPVYLSPDVLYKCVITDSADVSLPDGTVDPIIQVATAASIGAALYPLTDAEDDAGFTVASTYLWYAPGNVLRYRIVANDASARADNTAALLKLVSARGTSTFKGQITFPNLTGSDVYSLGDLIDFKDGIAVEGNHCTIQCTKAALASDVNAGWFMALRDFSLQNLTIQVNYNNGGTLNRANPLFFGWRDSTTYYPASYDSLLASPMGNITVRNVRISSNTANGNGILMFGGLSGVVIENIWIDGQGVLGQGVYYEFGWATNEANREDRQTSHLHNAQFRNIHVDDLESVTTGIAFGLGGAYDTLVEGLYVNGCKSYVSCTPGEALNYRPWVGFDDVGAGRAVVFRGVVGAGATSTAVQLTGAQLASGYLNPLGLGPKDETDLADYVFEDFAFLTGGAGHCIRSNAGKIVIRNGTIRGYNRGVVIENECTNYLIESVDVFDSGSLGIQCGLDNNIYPTERLAVGTLRNCFVAGSGQSGAAAAVSVDFCKSLLIEQCRFGYGVDHDGVAETTQLQAVSVGVTGYGVTCRGNHVEATSAAAAAYALAAALSSPRRCSIENASGILTRTGLWLKAGEGISDDRGDTNVTLVTDVDVPRQSFASALTANRTVTLSATNAVRGAKFRIVRTGLGAFTLAVGALKTIPNSTAAFVDVEHDGTAWLLTGYGAL